MKNEPLYVMQARHDQRQAAACQMLFSAPPEFALMLSKPEGVALEFFNDRQGPLWKHLLRFARLGMSATCLAVMAKAEELQELD